MDPERTRLRDDEVRMMGMVCGNVREVYRMLRREE